jgi:PAS domain S-box-containing protein
MPPGAHRFRRLPSLSRLLRPGRRRRLDDLSAERSMFDHAVWGMFQTSPEGHYLAANQALAELYGFESPAALLARLTDIKRQLYLDPRRREEFIQQMQQDGRVVGFESEVVRHDGRVIWISETCRSVRDRSGALLYYEGSVEDITPRKQTETELAAARAQAEAANRAKSTFLMHMSHELRTPLNAILGFAQLIRDTAPGTMPGEYQRYAADIHDSGTRLLAMVNDVLILTELEAGRARRQDDIVPLGRFLAACAASIEPSAVAKGVLLIQEAPPDNPNLHVDPRLLRIIVVKLLCNGVKFTEPGGTVTLFGRQSGDGGITIEIRDTGIGMSVEELDLAWQPFRQLDGGLARRYGGMGLGLPIAKAMAALIGGTLTLASTPGAGTTATLALPPGKVDHATSD